MGVCRQWRRISVKLPEALWAMAIAWDTPRSVCENPHPEELFQSGKTVIRSGSEGRPYPFPHSIPHYLLGLFVQSDIYGDIPVVLHLNRVCTKWRFDATIWYWVELCFGHGGHYFAEKPNFFRGMWLWLIKSGLINVAAALAGRTDKPTYELVSTFRDILVQLHKDGVDLDAAYVSSDEVAGLYCTNDTWNLPKTIKASTIAQIFAQRVYEGNLSVQSKWKWCRIYSIIVTGIDRRSNPGDYIYEPIQAMLV
jgi:hypothetical protein